ncbi:NfeD family protein [Ruminococcaceae bacterium OttesenSCG-928-I18]|nr:NfeD family protein [Ruminococcaceae bacterium OttesenSCG-928-I18]
MQWAPVIWLVLIVLFVVFEGLSSVLVSIWFCAGSIVALIVSLFLPEAYLIQFLAFAVVSILSMIALRPLAKKWVDTRRVPTNADANIGKIGQVITEIQPGRFGRVRLEGLDWTAQADVVLPVGSWCKVVSLDGVKLVVVPAAQETP